MKKQHQQYLKRAQSKEVLSTYSHNTSTQTVFPDFDPVRLREVVYADPVARGALIHYVDKAMEGDYAVVEKESGVYDPVFEMLLDEKYNFRHEVLRKLFLFRKLFNNAFVEIVRDTENKVKAINVIDGSLVEPVTTPNGDPIRFKSRIPYPGGHPQAGAYPTWEKEDMVWIKWGDRSAGYAPIDLKALWDHLHWKTYVERYAAWLWQTGQYRLMYSFESASDRDVESFLAYVRRNDENFKAPFITKGKMQSMLLRDMKETVPLVDLLKWLDSQTLILMRVPPIDAGIPDASGRSNADAQSNNFGTHIISDKKVIEDSVNFDLFKKINKGNNLLRFAPNDRFAETQVWENVNLLKNMGATNELLREYLLDRGMVFKTAELFTDPVAEAARMAEAMPDPVTGAPGMKKDINTMPSRAKTNSGSMNKVGTGSQASTRKDQVTSK
jgi:hypothetical protein